ncbi:MAG: rod shape-determining protein MreC [Firmicutes bacterium]|nr:rod shape-determining protein MreC [Bacillota bacterium]
MSVFKKHASKMIVIGVTIILLVIIGITARDRDEITFIESKIGNIITPVQRVVYNIGESFFDTFKSITSLSQIKRENENLKKKVEKLKKDNREMKEIISRTEYLRKEALLKEKSNYNFIDAEIVSKDPGSWFNKFVIDKGLKDGISKDDPVVFAVEYEGEVIEAGLVGRIMEVGENWAKVVSIIDKGSNVSFKDIRTQDNGIVSGVMDNDERLKGTLFDYNANVVKGDKLLTSGMGGLFIKNLYIGEVVEVEKRSEELVKVIKVKPAVDFRKLDEVYIITQTK